MADDSTTKQMLAGADMPTGPNSPPNPVLDSIDATMLNAATRYTAMHSSLASFSIFTAKTWIAAKATYYPSPQPGENDGNPLG